MVFALWCLHIAWSKLVHAFRRLQRRFEAARASHGRKRDVAIHNLHDSMTYDTTFMTRASHLQRGARPLARRLPQPAPAAECCVTFYMDLAGYKIQLNIDIRSFSGTRSLDLFPACLA